MSFRYCFVVALIAFAFVYVVNTPNRLGTAYAYMPSPEQAEEAAETAHESAEEAELQLEINPSLEIASEAAEGLSEVAVECQKEISAL